MIKCYGVAAIIDMHSFVDIQSDSSQLAEGDDVQPAIEILSSSSSQSSLGSDNSDNDIGDNEPDEIDSLFVISDEEPDTSGEAEAQSTVHNVAVMEGCTAAIAEPLRQCHTSELPPETCTEIGGLLALGTRRLCS